MTRKMRRVSEQISHALQNLQGAELVRAAIGESGDYLFRHALVQDTAYASLLKQERRYLHRLTAIHIERLYPQELDENAARLGEHYWLGEEWEKAADYSQRAGTNALRVYALREAMSHFERALDALDKIPAAAREQTIDVIVDWVQAAARFRPYAEQLTKLERAEALARELSDKPRLARTLYRIGSVYMASGQNVHATPFLAECFTLAEELGDEALTVAPTYFMATVLQDSDPRGAVELLERAIALADKHHNSDLKALSFGLKAMTEARLGEFENSQRSIQAAFGLLQDVQSPMTESDVWLFAAWSNLDMGNVARGLEFGQRGVDKALSSENMDCVCYGFACVGYANMQAQQLPRALEAFDEAIRRSRYSGARHVENIAASGRAMTKLFGGDAGALPELERAFEDAQQLENEFGTALVAQTLGEIFMRQGDADRAQVYLDSARAYFERADLQPYLARVLQSYKAHA